MSTIGAPSSFAADDGSADPAVGAALAAYALDPTAWAPAVAALAASRVLVPVVAAETGERSVGGAEAGTEMALALLQGTDGRAAVPGFTSAQALARWDPTARPVPVALADAALAAVEAGGGGGVLVVDVAGPVSFVLEEPVLTAVAARRFRGPLYDDAAVVAAVRDVAAGLDAVREVYLQPAADADARLVVVGGPAEAAGELAARLGRHDVLRAAVVRGLEVAVTAAGPVTGVRIR